jgi:hypothetical protein
VWGAIEAHRDALTLAGGRTTPTPGDAARERPERLTDTIGWLASAIYRDGTDRGHGAVEEHAAKILGTVLQLRQNLRDARRGRGRSHARARRGRGEAVRDGR